MWAGGGGSGLETHAVIGFSNIQGYLVKETLHSDARSRDAAMLSLWWGLLVNRVEKLVTRGRERSVVKETHRQKWWWTWKMLVRITYLSAWYIKVLSQLNPGPGISGQKRLGCRVAVWVCGRGRKMIVYICSDQPSHASLAARLININMAEQQQHHHQDTTRLLCFGLLSIVQM